MLPLRQKTEFGRLREVILGSVEKASFPGASDSNANFTDHIADLGPAFYDQWRDKYPNGEPIPYEVAKPELTEAYKQMHHDLAEAYEREGVKVYRIPPQQKRSSITSDMPKPDIGRPPSLACSLSSAMCTSRPLPATIS